MFTFPAEWTEEGGKLWARYHLQRVFFSGGGERQIKTSFPLDVCVSIMAAGFFLPRIGPLKLALFLSFSRLGASKLYSLETQ